MTTNNFNPTSIDEYISNYPDNIQSILEELRNTIRKVAPSAIETINYQIPTFTLYGNLVHFAAYKNHIGFYPSPTGIEAFKNELKLYKTSKGAIQFPIDKPIPLNIIAQIVTFRVDENIKKASKKSKK